MLLVLLSSILKNVFFLLYVYFKVVTHKSEVSPINWNIEKNTTLNTKFLKRGTKRINLKITWKIKFPFYLAFLTGIYLFKINNKNKKTLCKTWTKVKKKTPAQISEIKFLQMCSFIIILTSFHSLNSSFPYLFYVISTTMLKFPPWFPALPC